MATSPRSISQVICSQIWFPPITAHLGDTLGSGGGSVRKLLLPECTTFFVCGTERAANDNCCQYRGEFCWQSQTDKARRQNSRGRNVAEPERRLELVADLSVCRRGAANELMSACV